MAVTATPHAAKHIKRQLAERGKGLGIRIGVRTTGCSGMAYVLEFADDAEETDHVYEHAGVKIVIDPKSLVYLDGMEVDFVEEKLEQGFKFNNPNVTAECGCGESFTVKESVATDA